MTRDAEWLLQHFLEQKRAADNQRFKNLLVPEELQYDTTMDPISPDFDIRSWS